VLWGKYDIFDAAQYGLQRFMAKVVVPTALADVHFVQCVSVSWVYASAHVMMNVRGRAT
jgi:hypothetical protein